jgi:hypothetical protein
MSERVTAYDVAIDDGSGRFYSVDEKKVAEVLRSIADKIDKGEVESILHFKVLSQATGDYARTFVRFSFHESKPKAAAK